MRDACATGRARAADNSRIRFRQPVIPFPLSPAVPLRTGYWKCNYNFTEQRTDFHDHTVMTAR